MAAAAVDDARLVQEIRKHEALYDSRRRGNKDLADKGMAWADVSEALGISTLDAKNRWRNLRDRFVREKKRLISDGEKVYSLKDPWPLLDDMAFLWAFITHRNRSLDRPRKRLRVSVSESGVRHLQPILPRPTPEWVSVASDYDTREAPPPPAPALRPPPADPRCIVVEQEVKREVTEDDIEDKSHLRRLLVEGQQAEVDDTQLETLLDEEEGSRSPPPPTPRDLPKDEDELFCLSVAASFKRFTPKMKARAKWKIQQVLYDVEFNNQPEPSCAQDLNNSAL